MQVTCPNDIKIYNLSCGRSLPDWLSERKRRQLQKKDSSIRNRIQLIQDFEMPDVSTGVKVSRDGQYIVATGLYKPRVRCYDVNNLAMKFDRCFDAEVVQFLVLTDDYSKMVFLHYDRWIEFHVQYGKYHRWRIPKFGRDIAYQYNCCDLFFVGASPEIYRFNLEQGRFLTSVLTEASSLNKICVNPVHNLIVCGTVEGRVEAWDPRDKHRIGVLDCALSAITPETIVNGLPSVTALAFKGSLTLGVGTATGQVLLYDIRSTKPYTIRDHMNELPVTNIDFISNEDLVASMDSKCVKFWQRNTAKPFTHIEAPADLNDMCIVPDTGLIFLANEDKKLLTYYIPRMGPAPKWCYFLDSITEELEETKNNTIYDNYKFVTKKELEELGLSHLIGTNMLRGYMHGYFMDVRLYNKAFAMVKPFAFKEYQKKKIREKLEKERQSRVMKQALPTVNSALAQKLQEQQMEGIKSKQVSSLLEDNRFKAMFDEPEFQIDETAEEYNNLRPLLSKLDKKSQKKQIASVSHEQFEAIEEEEGKKQYLTSSEEESSEDESEDNDEEDSGSELEDPSANPPSVKKPRLYEIKDSENFKMLKKDENAENKSLPLGERLLKLEETVKEESSSSGNKTVTFALKKLESHQKQEEERKAHMKERSMYRRPAKPFRN